MRRVTGFLKFLEGWRKQIPQRCTVKMCVEYIICQDFCRWVCVVKFLSQFINFGNVFIGHAFAVNLDPYLVYPLKLCQDASPEFTQGSSLSSNASFFRSRFFFKKAIHLVLLFMGLSRVLNDRLWFFRIG